MTSLAGTSHKPEAYVPGIPIPGAGVDRTGICCTESDWSLVRFILLRTSWTCDMPPSMKCVRYFCSFIPIRVITTATDSLCINVGDALGVIAVVIFFVIGLFELDQE